MTDILDDDVFSSTTDDQRASRARSSAVKSVQSSLFRRLGDRGYGKAGALAWLLCFAGNPTSPKCERAKEKLRARPAAELAGLLEVCRGVVTAKNANDEWRAFATQIATMLQAVIQETAPVVTTYETDAAFAIRLAVISEMKNECEARGEKWDLKQHAPEVHARTAEAQKKAGT